jgi:hypothetical protein
MCDSLHVPLLKETINQLERQRNWNKKYNDKDDEQGSSCKLSKTQKSLNLNRLDSISVNINKLDSINTEAYQKFNEITMKN